MAVMKFSYKFEPTGVIVLFVLAYSFTCTKMYVPFHQKLIPNGRNSWYRDRRSRTYTDGGKNQSINYSGFFLSSLFLLRDSAIKQNKTSKTSVKTVLNQFVVLPSFFIKGFIQIIRHSKINLQRIFFKILFISSILMTAQWQFNKTYFQHKEVFKMPSWLSYFNCHLIIEFSKIKMKN